MKRLSLQLDTGENFGTIFPVTQGIPFPNKELERGTPVRVVDKEKRPIPTQYTCLATWNNDLAYVKWLLVDFIPDTAKHNCQQLYLEYGADVKPEFPENPVFTKKEPVDPVSIGNHEVTINNKILELKLSNATANVFQSIKFIADKNNRELIDIFSGPFLYMKDQYGMECSSREKGPRPEIIIEDSGPVRASLCIKGYHVSKKGLRFCPYILRLHVFSGRSDVRIFHTFIFDQDPERIRISEIGMKFPFTPGGATTGLFGCDKSIRKTRQNIKTEVIQYSDQEYATIENGVAKRCAGQLNGWGCIHGKNASLAIALRDIWQEYPKAFIFDKKGMDIQLFPSSLTEPLNLETPWKEPFIRGKTEEELLAKMKEHPKAGINFKGFLGKANVPQESAEGNEQSMIEAKKFAKKHLRNRYVAYGDTGCNLDGGTGLSKTHEFWVDFCPDTDGAALNNWSKCIQNPPIAPAQPSYMCDTGALRIIKACSPEENSDIEHGLELMFNELWLNPIKKCRLYGMLDYGDLPNCHLRNDGIIYQIFKNEPDFKITDLIGWYNNEGFDLGYSLWQFFARTGERKYWKFAEANSEHVEDVDTIHFHPLRQEIVGLTHYHNMLHWSGAASLSHTHVHGWLLHYFFTGNRRALDVAREAVDRTLRNQEPSGINKNRHRLLRREFASPIASLWDFYQATWEEKYGDCARRSVDALIKTQTECGWFPRDIFTDGDLGDIIRTDMGPDKGAGGMECYTLYDAYRITKDPQIKNTILKIADYYVENKLLEVDPGEHGSEGIIEMNIPAIYLAFAFQLTGNSNYLSPLEKALDLFPEMARKYAVFNGKTCFRALASASQFVVAALKVIEGRKKDDDNN